LYRLGQTEAARERFYEAVQCDGEYVEAWGNLGCVLSELDRPDEAVEALECALAIHAGYADAHYHLADILEESGRPEDAADHWRAYLEHDRRSTWADEARRRLEALGPVT
jgi:tetratricopeptide (TPR) repeat protein